jgi:hypothetical protein
MANVDVVDELLDDEFIARIAHHIKDVLSELGESEVATEVQIPRFRRLNQTADNHISRYLYEALEFKLNEYLQASEGFEHITVNAEACLVLKQEIPRRATESILGRVFSHAPYRAEGLPEDSFVFLMEDHVQYGGTLLCRAKAVEEAGGTIIGFGALTRLPEMDNLRPNEQVVVYWNHLLQNFDGLQNGLMRNGLHYEGMTTREIIAMSALLLDCHTTLPTGGGSEVSGEQWFNGLLTVAGFDRKLVEHPRDCALATFLEPPLEVSNLFNAVNSNKGFSR